MLTNGISSHRVLPFLVFHSLFTDEEIQAIRNMTYYDVLLAVTSAEATDIQKNVFFWKDGKMKNISINICFICKKSIFQKIN